MKVINIKKTAQMTKYILFCNKITKKEQWVLTSGSSTKAPTLIPPYVNAFRYVSEDEIRKITGDSPTKSCLLDPIPDPIV